MSRSSAISGLWVCCLVLALLGTSLLATEQRPALQARLAEARQSGSELRIRNALISLGDHYRDTSLTKAALASYLEAYGLARKARNLNDLIYLSVGIANLKDKEGQLSDALEYYTEALRWAKTGKDQAQLAKIHNNIGNLYLKIGSFGRSLKHYQDALDIKRGINDPAELANALMNLSLFYLKTGSYDRGLEYQFQALKIREKGDDLSALAAVYSSISIGYRHLKDYPKAFEYNRKALAIQQKLNNPAKIASLYNNLGVLYFTTGDLNQAKQAYLKSYELKKSSEDKHSVLASLVNLGSLSLDLKQLAECKRWLDLAAELEPSLQSYEIIRNLAKLRADYYQATGAYKDAVTQLKLYHSISDSLSSLEKARQLNELEVRYEVEEKQRNIDLLTRNNLLNARELKNSVRMRNYLYLILALILVAMLLGLWRYLSVLRLSKKLYAAQADLNAMNRDLEKRVETEVEIRQSQEQKALRQSRLALLGELAAGISHELNQPMQTLSFTLENIKSAFQDDSLDASYLERKLKLLFEDITRMQNVINHIRCFSKPQEEGEDSRFDLKPSIQNAVEMVSDQFQRLGIALELDLPEADLRLRGNSFQFEQVILNLLTNARDAIRQQSSGQASRRGIISIRAAQQGDRVIIRVSDNGCGVPTELGDQIFEIFFSTKDLEQGTGLGLAISKSTLARMKGGISYTSTPGSGTEFTIDLPIITEGESHEDIDPGR